MEQKMVESETASCEILQEEKYIMFYKIYVL